MYLASKSELSGDDGEIYLLFSEKYKELVLKIMMGTCNMLV